jgi:hypothetical protein
MVMDPGLVRFWMDFGHLPLRIFLYGNDQFEVLPIDQRCKLVLLRKKTHPYFALLLGDMPGHYSDDFGPTDSCRQSSENWAGGDKIVVSLNRKPGDIFQDHKSEDYSFACGCCHGRWLTKGTNFNSWEMGAKIVEVGKPQGINTIVCKSPLWFFPDSGVPNQYLSTIFVDTTKFDEMKQIQPAIALFDEMIKLEENGKPLSSLCGK